MNNQAENRLPGEALTPDDVQYEVWQGGGWEAGADSLSDAQHYMAVYGQDGPVEAVTAFTYRFPGFTAKPFLIPASDLEQVTRERDGLYNALNAAEAWINRWSVHVGACAGGSHCTCGRTAIIHEAQQALNNLDNRND